MTEFNPLLGKSKVQVTYTDSSEQEDESSKPLLRMKNIEVEDQVRYRPKSMSMLARSNYASSESHSSSKTVKSIEKVEVTARPKSMTETSSQQVFVSETKAENLFVKSFVVASKQSKKSVKQSVEKFSSVSGSSNSFTVRPITNTEPMYLEELEPPGVAPEIQSLEKTIPREDSPEISNPLSSNTELLPSTSPISIEENKANEDDRSSVTSSSSQEDTSDSDASDYPTPTVNLQSKPIATRQPIVPGIESTIEINKGIDDLGLNVIGGADTLLGGIYILSIAEHGAAEKDGRLWPGDQILSVNNTDLRLLSHEEAIDIIRNSSAIMTFVILRDGNKSKAFLRYQRKIKVPLLSHWDTINNEKESDLYDAYDVKLKKKGNQSIGLCIIGRRNDPGVFITDVTVGSVAAKDGRIQKGDQILAINGKDIKMAGQEVAVSLVQNTQGTIEIRMGRLKCGLPTDLMDMPVEKDKTSEDGHPSITSLDRERKHTRFIEIEKPYNTSLGIYIAGGVGSPLGDIPVFVAMIEETNVVAGKLRVGDVITSVNGQTTEKKTHDEVVAMMSTAEDMIILMQVQDPTPQIEQMTSYLNQAVKKRNEKPKISEVKKSKASNNPNNLISLQPEQVETMIY